MNGKRISSVRNPVVKLIRHAARRSRSAPEDLVLAEGVRALEEATRSDYAVEAVLAADSFGSNRREQALLEAWRARSVQVFQGPDSLVRSLSRVRSPQGALALVRVPLGRLEEIRLPDHPLILCACRLQEPGNLGLLIRTALAVEATLVCTTRGTVSARNPRAVRASAGAFFHLPVVEGLEPDSLLGFCRDRGIRPYRTAPREGSLYSGVNLRGGCAILVGNEGSGFQEPPWVALPAIRIPMAVCVESLNVAVAGSILLFEAFRQRTAPRTEATEES